MKNIQIEQNQNKKRRLCDYNNGINGINGINYINDVNNVENNDNNVDNTDIDYINDDIDYNDYINNINNKVDNIDNIDNINYIGNLNNLDNINDIDIFILNMNNLLNYKLVNPNELIIINSSNEYSNIFYQTIVEGGKKTNVKKIITSDSVITEYIKYIEPNFELLFPNCKTIQINSYSNNFSLISRIIDDLKIIKKIEYVLNDNIFIKNSIFNYIYFTKSFFTGGLSNISFVKIINNITKETECSVEKKIISSIIDLNYIEEINKLQYENIKKYKLDNSCINNTVLEYIDVKMNIYVKKYIYNIIDIDLTLDLLEL